MSAARNEGRPTTRAARAEASRRAAERRAAKAAGAQGTSATRAPTDEEINAVAAEHAPAPAQVFGTAGDLPPWEPVHEPIPEPQEEPLVPDGELLELEGGWKLAQRVGRTLCRRMAGPFYVDTPHGTVRCADGWLAVDAHGEPYPIDARTFGRSYVVSGEASRPDLAALSPGLAAKVRAS